MKERAKARKLEQVRDVSRSFEELQKSNAKLNGSHKGGSRLHCLTAFAADQSLARLIREIRREAL
jgi:hypothetical protein